MSRSEVAELNTEEAVHLGALNTAGVDEGAFQLAIEALRDAPGLSDNSVMNIAKGYIGDPLPLAVREAALGAKETEFYEGRRAIPRISRSTRLDNDMSQLPGPIAPNLRWRRS